MLVSRAINKELEIIECQLKSEYIDASKDTERQKELKEWDPIDDV